MADRNISAQWLRENFDYNPETGEFFTKPRKVGHLGLYGRNRDYPAVVLSLRPYVGKFYAHRVAWLWMTGHWPDAEIDHINGDSADNRWCNLREATRSENCRNTRAPSHNTSGFTGAYWANDRKRWFSRIGKKGGYLGTFKNAEEAHEAYKKAIIQKYGKFLHPRFKRF
jgi:hypothetical protein